MARIGQVQGADDGDAAVAPGGFEEVAFRVRMHGDEAVKLGPLAGVKLGDQVAVAAGLRRRGEGQKEREGGQERSEHGFS